MNVCVGADGPFAVVTTTSAGPSAPAGVTATICVLPNTWTSVAGTPPTVTVDPGVKFVPVIVMAVPPVTGPWSGVSGCMTGAAVTGRERVE